MENTTPPRFEDGTLFDPRFVFIEDMLKDFVEWSKVAEWQDGTKQMFIANDWEGYIKEYAKQRKIDFDEMTNDIGFYDFIKNGKRLVKVFEGIEKDIEKAKENFLLLSKEEKERLEQQFNGTYKMSIGEKIKEPIGYFFNNKPWLVAFLFQLVSMFIAFFSVLLVNKFWR